MAIGSIVPAFDTAAASVVAASPAEVAIPDNSSGGRPKFVMITTDSGTVITFKVGMAGVDVGTEPHGYFRDNAPLILNVFGQEAIDFTGSGNVIVTPLANG